MEPLSVTVAPPPLTEPFTVAKAREAPLATFKDCELNVKLVTESFASSATAVAAAALTAPKRALNVVGPENFCPPLENARSAPLAVRLTPPAACKLPPPVTARPLAT